MLSKLLMLYLLANPVDNVNLGNKNPEIRVEHTNYLIEHEKDSYEETFKIFFAINNHHPEINDRMVTIFKVRLENHFPIRDRLSANKVLNWNAVQIEADMNWRDTRNK